MKRLRGASADAIVFPRAVLVVSSPTCQFSTSPCSFQLPVELLSSAADWGGEAGRTADCGALMSPAPLTYEPSMSAPAQGLRPDFGHLARHLWPHFSRRAGALLKLFAAYQVGFRAWALFDSGARGGRGCFPRAITMHQEYTLWSNCLRLSGQVSSSVQGLCGGAAVPVLALDLQSCSLLGMPTGDEAVGYVMVFRSSKLWSPAGTLAATHVLSEPSVRGTVAHLSPVV